MKASTSPSKTGYFLIELLIVIAFFAVAASMCVQVFVKSHLISIDSRDLSRSVTEAQSAAEAFKAAGSGQEVATLLAGSLSGDTVTVYYDAGWQKVAQPAEKGFCLQVVLTGGGPGQSAGADIAVTALADQSQAIYTLAVKRFTPI